MTTTETGLILAHEAPALLLAGQAANGAAARGLFADYRERKAANTRRRQDDGLTLFASFLGNPPPDGAGIPGAPRADELAGDPAAWRGVSWGLVAAFVRWLLGRGYAIGTVNGHLSTVKVYAKLAAQAGALDREEYAMIRLVEGYRRNEAKHVDELRDVTRRGLKKADPVRLTADQAAALKRQADTPQGRRDAVLVALLIDHGLRAGELAGLTVADVDLGAGELRFYRPKVDRDQVHRLTPDARRAIRAYMDAGDAPALGPLLRASHKDGELGASGMTARAISGRVCELGAAVGASGLSAHDLRHTWATRAARNGTPLDRLQDAGGWASPAMPLRYVEAAKIANQGVNLGG
jgi:integrase